MSMRAAGTGVLAVAALLMPAGGAQAAPVIGPLTSANGCAALSPGGTRAATSTTSSATSTSTTTTTSTSAVASTAQASSTTTATSTSTSASTSSAARGTGPGPNKGCGGASGLASPTGAAISPDGTSIYVIGGTPGTFATTAYGVLDILHRDPATGDLTEVGCLSSDGTDGNTGASQACVSTPGLLGGGAVIVSPDGSTVYAGSSWSAALLAFHRDPATGLLTRFGCLRLTPPLNSGCSAANVFGGIDALAISPDGLGLYAASGAGGPTPGATTALSVITAGLLNGPATTSSTSTSTPTTSTTATTQTTTSTTQTATSTPKAPTLAMVFGSLSPGVPLANPCLATGGVDGACTNDTAAMGLTSLAMSADGHFLYATAMSSGAVDVFARDAAGGLTQTGCLMVSPPPGPCATFGDGAQPSDIALSADEKNAYVVNANGIQVASRAASGSLTGTGCVQAAPLADNTGSSGDNSGNGSGDNSGSGNGTSGSQSRARASADVACTTADGLTTSVAAAAVSADGAAVYATNKLAGGLVTFARDASTGALTESSCAGTSTYLDENTTSSCVKAPGGAADDLVLAPDGRNVYVLDPSTEALYGYGPAATATASTTHVHANGLAALRIACPSAARSLCVGRVQLSTPRLLRRSSRHRSHARTAAVHTHVIGGAPASSAAVFRLSPGRTTVVRVRIPHAVRSSVRRHHGLRLVAEVRPRPGGGGASARHVMLR
jgi:hypothetical protein